MCVCTTSRLTTSERMLRCGAFRSETMTGVPLSLLRARFSG
jgi:hypothetical protein